MRTPTAHAAFAGMSRAETLLGLPGPAPTSSRPAPGGLTTRQALEAALTEALVASPCFVLFSGGRDSSAMLALATFVARRDGLPEPVPVTVRHPAAPETDETRWQELVLEHLRLREHIVLEFDGEQRLLGTVATAALHRHGPVWPEAVQLHGAIYRHLDRGAVVSGEGGDILLAGHRMSDLRSAVTRRRPTRSSLARGWSGLRPGVLLRREVRRNAPVPPWLRPSAAAQYLRHLEAVVAQPLRWDSATRSAMYSRPTRVFAANFAAGIAEYGLLPVNPLLDDRVVEAIAREAGPLGWGNRTAVFRRLFHDVLPDQILRRTSKAYFNSTRWGPDELDFARTWDGQGLDPDWIDAERLRAAWLSADHHPSADFLLHVAWAGAQGLPTGLEHSP